MLSLQIVTFVGGKISVPVWCFFQETCLQFTFRETSGTHQPDAEMSMFLKCKRTDHRLCKLFRIFPIASMLPYKQRTESLVDSWSSRHIGVYVSANFPLLPPFSTQNIDLFVKVSRMNMAFLSVFFYFFSIISNCDSSNFSHFTSELSLGTLRCKETFDHDCVLIASTSESAALGLTYMFFLSLSLNRLQAQLQLLMIWDNALGPYKATSFWYPQEGTC